MLNSAQYLIDKYYTNSNFESKVISSYWRDLTKNSYFISNATTRIEDIKIKGYGFGDYKKRNILGLIRNLPTFLYLQLRVIPKCNKYILSVAIDNAKKTDQLITHDSTRFVFTLDLLQKYVPDLNHKTVVIIGDGYARMGSLIKGVYPNAKIIFINLGRTLLFDLVYAKKAFPQATVKIFNFDSGPNADLNFLEAEEFTKFNISGDLFINIASMQEMNYSEINKYFKVVKDQKLGTYFYCCNRESKELPDGSIIEFKNFPWAGLKTVMLEECVWHREFPKNRPPFIGRFDGPVLHSISKVVGQ
jgi:hypothetical protein